MLQLLPPIFLSITLVLFYLGERVVSGYTLRLGFAIAASICLLLSFVTAFLRRALAWDARQLAWTSLLFDYAICVLALALYCLQTDVADVITNVKWRQLLQVIWPFVLLLGLLPAMAIEIAMRGMARATTLELWRVRLAARAARIVVLACITFAGINFAASEWNRKTDLSYFKTTKPGTSTQNIVRDLTKPVRFILFFPPSNDVLENVRHYTDTLKALNPNVSVDIVDHALHPEIAKAFRVRANGFVVLQAGDRNEQLALGLDIGKARSDLRDLDRQMQAKLLAVVRPARTVYFMSGHQERDYAPPKDDMRQGLSDLRGLIETLGCTVKRMGLGEGSGTRVPEDATAVFIIDPKEPLLPAEILGLEQFLARGGSIFLAVDPETSFRDPALFKLLGISTDSKIVANEKYTVKVEGRGESQYDLVTNRFSSHPSVTTLSHSYGRLVVALLSAGALTQDKDTQAKIDFTLSAMEGSYLDLNRNGVFDAKTEKKTKLDFAAAVEGKIQGDKNNLTHSGVWRAVVLADADALGNGVVRNSGNAYFVLDSLRWLTGDEKQAGTVESEKDEPLIHRKDQDALWFYGTSFLVPALVLGIGLGTRRRMRKTRGTQ
jgi:hypothetical protein